MQRRAKIGAWLLGGGGALGILLLGAGWLVGNTGSGRSFIERTVSRLTSGHVTLSGLDGYFPTQLTLRELRLSDKHGVWLVADHIVLTWSPLKLLERRIRVDTVRAARVHMERRPISDTPGGSVSIPHIEVDDFAVDAVELGAPLVGTPARLALRGKLKMRSLQNADVEVAAHRLDGDGDYELRLQFDPEHMDAVLALHEPASGPLENLLSLPGLGALSASVNVHGPRTALNVDLKLAAGALEGVARGSIDLEHESAELQYSLHAPALSPRADLSWSEATLTGSWHGPLSTPTADGKLAIDSLRVPGGVKMGRFDATLAASGGKLRVQALVDGLLIPGPSPRVLADSRLTVDATVALDQAGHPLDLAASHALFKLRAHAPSTGASGASGAAGAAGAGARHATFDLSVPDVAPFAAMAGQDVHGTATIKGQVQQASGGATLALDAVLGLAGGGAPWEPLIGPRVAVKLEGLFSNDIVKLQTLRVTAAAITLTANGTASLTPAADRTTKPAAGSYIQELKARWQLEVADLAQLSEILHGNMSISGQIGGRPDALSADAELSSHLSVRGSALEPVSATLHAHGLPARANATVQAHGMLDDAPLNIDATVEQAADKTYRVVVRQGGWKSAHMQGGLTTDASLTDSHGELQLHVGQLEDFNRLLGIKLVGTLDGEVRILPPQGTAPARGHSRAQLQLDAKHLAWGQFSGDMHLEAGGTADAVDLKLTAQLPTLYGMPAKVEAAGTLDANARQLRLSTVTMKYRGEVFRLLAPSLVSYTGGISIDALSVGARDAVLEIKGQVAPLLDLRASLSHVTPELVNVFSPGLLAGGRLDAQTKLRGTLADLAGGARIDAVGIRFADDAATGLPPVDLHGRAQLANSTMTIKSSLSAGPGSQLSVAGNAPLNPDGALDLKIDGKLDTGLANPLLEARGLHATGELKVAATITGSYSAPQVGGGMTLSKGSLRDYGRGVNLSDVEADVVGDNAGLLIKSFKATAVSGSLGLTGRIGILEPGMPVDLKLTASNAQPLASSLLTANLDADIAVKGTLRERIDVAGKIHVNRATIGIPNSLPPDVAVLDVRRRGKTDALVAGKPLVIGIDLVVAAPQEVLVQGRGLDAELGGEVRLTGTTEDLVASGGFNLQRGRFTLGNSRLEFTSDSRVGFDGAGLRKKIDPTLDFTANTTVGETTATLRITGQADAPRFDFSSSPSQPQDEIMALLLFGKPAQQLTAFELAQIGAALASLSGVGGNGLNPLVKIQKTLGLDRLTVGSNTTTTATGGTENQGAAIAAGRYVSKRIYIEGKQTTTGTSQVQVDVDLTKHLKLQTRLGNGTAVIQGTTPENDPGSSVGLSYQFEY